MSLRDAPTQPPPRPITLAQKLREKASAARVRATLELRSARDLEDAAARLELEERK